MKWLRAHMREHIADSLADDQTKNVLSFRRQEHSAEISTKAIPGSRALDLVCQAAEIIRNSDDYAAERLARAETQVKQAIEELKIAHARAHSAETKQRAAEAALKSLIVKVDYLERAIAQAIPHFSDLLTSK